MKRFRPGDLAYFNQFGASGRLVEVVELSESTSFDVDGPVGGRVLIRPLGAPKGAPAVWCDYKGLLQVKSSLKPLAEQAE